jgi:hypothetical protein
VEQAVGVHCGGAGDLSDDVMRRRGQDHHADWASGDEWHIQRLGWGPGIEHRDGVQRG